MNFRIQWFIIFNLYIYTYIIHNYNYMYIQIAINWGIASPLGEHFCSTDSVPSAWSNRPRPCEKDRTMKSRGVSKPVFAVTTWSTCVGRYREVSLDSTYTRYGTRPGKHTKNDGQSPCFMENSLFLWPFSIAMLAYMLHGAGIFTYMTGWILM
jgi:hypothetical protein